LGKVALHLLLVLLCLLTIFPLLWMVSTAFKAPEEIFTPQMNLLPTSPTVQNFPEAFERQPVGRWLLNSIVIAIAITVGKLLVSIPAAYAFARCRFYGRNVLFALVVGTMIVPDVITIVPNYVLVSDLDWMNTPQGVIVPMVAFTGFYVFLLRQAMLSLPQEILDAARVDGANAWTILWRIVLPLVRPAVAVVAILSFLSAWNLYLWPLLVLGDAEAKTIAVGMQYFALTSEGGGKSSWGPLMATATLAMLPPLLLYLAAQKAIVSAFVETGLKR
jgi:multiple sugar transport system permease protein/sn-glycerol 3-phosphate transport system permease protein